MREPGDEFGGDPGQFVGGEVACGEGGAPKEVVDGIRHRHQLAVAQIKSLVLHGVVTPSDYADNSSSRHPRVDDLGLAVDELSQGVLEPAIHFHHLAGWILLNYQ